jgi:hypothetical protein
VAAISRAPHGSAGAAPASERSAAVLFDPVGAALDGAGPRQQLRNVAQCNGPLVPSSIRWASAALMTNLPDAMSNLPAAEVDGIEPLPDRGQDLLRVAAARQHALQPNRRRRRAPALVAVAVGGR